MTNVPMTLPDLVLATHKTPFFHSSTFVELDDGRILHAAGSRFTTSDDGGITWSDISERHDVNGHQVGGSGSSLVKLDGNGIGLAAMAPSEDDDPWTRCVQFWRSPDGGETWEAPVRVSPVNIKTHMYQDVALRTSSGRIILPVYTSSGQRTPPNNVESPVSGKLVHNQWVSTAGHFFDPGYSMVYVLYSDDDGRTWQRNSDGELNIIFDWNATFSYVNEPTVTEVMPGILLMMMRTGVGRIYQAWSHDNGETWTRPYPTSLASSTAPCQIRTLPTGHLLAVWNQENEEEVKMGFNRTRLSSAVSRNGGSIWEFFQNVESIHEKTRVEPGPIAPLRPAEQHYRPGRPAPEREAEYIESADAHGRWSYPSVFVMKDRVIIAHTYTFYKPHPTDARIISDSGKGRDWNQKMKVLPLNWFYGGLNPADNPILRVQPGSYDIAVP